MNIQTAEQILQKETLREIRKVSLQTIAGQAQMLGMNRHEPLLYAMDGMLAYAKAYQKRFDAPVGSDGVLGEAFAGVIKGLRALLNGDGAVAMEQGLTSDSKDNGTIDSLYWIACKVAGIDGDSI